MKKNMISFGERSINGVYGNILAAGNLSVQESKVRYLAGAGYVQAANSSFNKVKIAGQFIADNSQLSRMYVTGDAKLNGICKGEIISAIGSLYATYLDCKILRNGTANRSSKPNQNVNHCWSGVFYAKTFENGGSLDMNFEYHFSNIISTADLYSTKAIECERFYSLSNLQAEAINADRIFVLATQKVEAKQLTGEEVTIRRSFKPDREFKMLPKISTYKNINVKGSIAKIDVIEADRIDIEYTKSILVCGEDVRIGDLCIIDHVEYRNSIEISKKAIVNEVVKI